MFMRTLMTCLVFAATIGHVRFSTLLLRTISNWKPQDTPNFCSCSAHVLLHCPCNFPFFNYVFEIFCRGLVTWPWVSLSSSKFLPNQHDRLKDDVLKVSTQVCCLPYHSFHYSLKQYLLEYDHLWQAASVFDAIVMVLETPT